MLKQPAIVWGMSDSTRVGMGVHESPNRVYGVDFSADRSRGGKEMWIAEGVVENGLRVVEAAPATDWLGVGHRREDALPALTRFLGKREGGTATGLDFPFGLPNRVTAADTWPEFLRQFPSWADDPSDLARESETRARLNGGGDATELLRATEEPLGAISPYNKRLRTETFYGIRDVLRPLILADAVRAAPMQTVDPDLPILLEVYPTGTLERLDAHDLRYVGGDEDARDRRAANLHVLETAGVTIGDAVRDKALNDGDGNALNAVVATVATYQHTRNCADLKTDDRTRSVEGHIYV